MSTIKLEYNIPEESGEAQSAVQGHLWKNVAYDMDNCLRNMIKHGGDMVTSEQLDVYQDIRDMHRGIIEGNGLILD